MIEIDQDNEIMFTALDRFIDCIDKIYEVSYFPSRMITSHGPTTIRFLKKTVLVWRVWGK